MAKDPPFSKVELVSSETSSSIWEASFSESSFQSFTTHSTRGESYSLARRSPSWSLPRCSRRSIEAKESSGEGNGNFLEGLRLCSRARRPPFWPPVALGSPAKAFVSGTCRARASSARQTLGRSCRRTRQPLVPARTYGTVLRANPGRERDKQPPQDGPRRTASPPHFGSASSDDHTPNLRTIRKFA